MPRHGTQTPRACIAIPSTPSAADSNPHVAISGPRFGTAATCFAVSPCRSRRATSGRSSAGFRRKIDSVGQALTQAGPSKSRHRSHFTASSSNTPPLDGGASAYPASFIAGLPPNRLAFSYPGHLRLVNHGYLLGGQWIREHPGAALELAAKKLTIFWRGATLGLTGWNLPLGQGGLRRAVDLVTPEGGWPAVWR